MKTITWILIRLVKDPLGFNVCRITAEYKDNERKLALFVQDKMEQWYRAAGAIAVERAPVGPMGPSTHAYGGTRMGDNAETNVVNRWGFSHEVQNLGIVGASVDGDERGAQPDAHGTSAGMAHGGVPDEELQLDRTTTHLGAGRSHRNR